MEFLIIPSTVVHETKSNENFEHFQRICFSKSARPKNYDIKTIYLRSIPKRLHCISIDVGHKRVLNIHATEIEECMNILSHPLHITKEQNLTTHIALYFKKDPLHEHTYIDIPEIGVEFIEAFLNPDKIMYHIQYCNKEIYPNKTNKTNSKSKCAISLIDNCLFDFLDWFSFGLLSKTSNIEL
jgi:hypothetical protein